ncbi:response regulator [Pseudopedobacter beijingensis]|uniref:histidine kinase n=1 Tax=Pseudopedobacter beijingensis TaxID=1207056 RepID=A0ABW4IBF6_9SPHI
MVKTFLKNLQLGFGISLLILFISSTASFISIKKLEENKDRLMSTSKSIKLLDAVLKDLQDAEVAHQNYLLTGNKVFLTPYHRALQDLPKSLNDLNDIKYENTSHITNINKLKISTDERVKAFERLLKIKKDGGTITLEQLNESKELMDDCSTIINKIVSNEELVLYNTSVSLDIYSKYTLLFIITATLISLSITIFLYRRVKRDYSKREELQGALRTKEAEIGKRIQIIEKIAKKISNGNYNISIDNKDEDDLGSVAGSLNTMAISLKESFEKINNKEWVQYGLASLNKGLLGDKTAEEISDEALSQLVHHSESLNGALYLLQDSGELKLQSSYGLEKHMLKNYEIGEGMIGQTFISKKIKHIDNLDSNSFNVSFANGKLKISNLILLPLLMNKQCIGVIELGFDEPINEYKLEYLTESCRGISLAIEDSKNRSHIQKLLEETQAQTEELQSQHSELEGLNTELEAQTQKLQASEEELKVQQEELLQSNQELEERSRSLEEKNQLIAERNLEIQHKAEQLALSTKYKSEFLANMSHELRTPLNSILLLSRLLAENEESNLNTDQVESAKVIQSSGSSLLHLIDEILDLSKIEAGKMVLDIQKENLSDIVQTIKSLFNPLAQEKKLDLLFHIEEGLNPIIETDRLRLEQILKNLISNALKFTSEGNVSLSIKQTGDELIFIVRDTGIGISTEQQKIIFEAFRQADGSTRRRFGGTGLGLSISKEIAKLFGGQISLKSETGKGSTFTLTIPKNHQYEPQHQNIDELLDDIAHEVLESNNLVETPKNIETISIPDGIDDDRHNLKLGDKIILIVEDDINFAKALLNFTRKQNYKGIIAVRGDIAAGLAEKHLPLAILLDIQLPVKDGWQVMDEIKNNPITKHIPVHIMSSLQVKKESLKKGAIDFINKPVALEQIHQMFKKIEDALNRYPKKVLIIEENRKHASALSYFLSSFEIATEIKSNISDSIHALMRNEADCVILDMGLPDRAGYDALEAMKKNPGLENLPIIVFTGKNLSQQEEAKIRQYADSIVLKTAHSYKRILDEVGLFLHLVEENSTSTDRKKGNKLGSLQETLKDKKILIADDDVRNIFSLSKALEKYQVRVISAIDGKDALEQLENNPDTTIVLMDMMMPEMDGYETIKRIRQIPEHKNLPIIAVTAKAMVGDREKCIKAGASDYISKPVDTDQLLSLLRVWLYE